MKRNCDFIFQHIVRMVHSPVILLDDSGNLKNSYGMQEGGEDLTGEREKELKKSLLMRATSEYPAVYIRKYPVAYGVVKGHGQIAVIGPVNMKWNETVFYEEIILLHNLWNDTNMSYQEFSGYNFDSMQLEHDVLSQRTKVFFDHHEKEKLHNPYDREKREMESIRRGDDRQLLRSLNEVFAGEYGVLSKDELRSAKNLGICGVTLASRAAIEGGILPEISFSMCDSYIMKIDEALHKGQVEALVRKAKFEYAGMVKEKNGFKEESELTEQCKNIIFQNMHGKIQVKEIAARLHVTAGYLSTAFAKQEGITIGQYIAREKTRVAENLLVYSDYSYGEIAYYLGFCSQSHFGKVFKQVENMTPGEYRRKYGVSSFMKEFQKLENMESKSDKI